MTIGPRRRSRTIPGHPQSPYGLLRAPRNRASWGWTCILSFRTFSILNVPNALSTEIPGRGTPVRPPDLAKNWEYPSIFCPSANRFQFADKLLGPAVLHKVESHTIALFIDQCPEQGHCLTEELLQ